MTISRLMKKSMQMLLNIAIAAAISTNFPKGVQGAPQRIIKPNLIYILADDAGYGDFGAYGQKEIQTPHLDQMAEEGIVFTNHYAGSAVCAPSRASLLTGKHTGHAPIRGNVETIPEGQHPLPDNTVTLAKTLKQAGLKTGVFGKWGLGGPGTSGVPNLQGFDEWFGYLCQRQAHSYYPDHLWRNGEKVNLEGKVYTHDLFTEEALRFIQDNQDNPFFLYLPYTIPHAKLQVPDLEPYADKDWPENKKRYAAMITRMDKDIGRLLKLLNTLELDEQTLVVFSSDNGPHAEGGANPAYFNSAGPFRGLKRDLYEGGIRVPMIARWPGSIGAGRTTDHLSAFWDVLPTFAELTGTEIPIGIDGLSFAPTLLGNIDLQQKHDYLYWEIHEHAGAQAIRKGQWKALRKEIRFDAQSPIELYDLHKDPGETKDLSQQFPAITQEMNLIFSNARTPSETFPLIEQRVFHFGPYNAWLFSMVMLSVSILFLLIGKLTNRTAFISRLEQNNPLGNAALLGKFTVSLVLYAISIYLPLWGDTPWFDYGLYLSLGGLAGYSLIQIYILIKGLDRKTVRSFYRLSYGIKEAFWLIFWAGVAVATVTMEIFWLLLLSGLCGYFVLQAETKGEAHQNRRIKIHLND